MKIIYLLATMLLFISGSASALETENVTAEYAGNLRWTYGAFVIELQNITKDVNYGPFKYSEINV